MTTTGNPRELAPATARGQYWACTINARDDDPDGFDLQRSIEQIESLHEDGVLSYAVGQWERGDDTGRLHLQVYLIFKKQRYCNWIASRIDRSMLFLSRAEWAKGGIAYCKDPTKDSFVDEAFEYGKNPTVFQGKRTDLDEVNKMIADNKLTTYREVNDYRTSVAARHANWVNWRLSEASRDEYLSEERYDDPYVPRVWQYWMSRILDDTRPSERKIMFVVDKIGHAGKTRFTFEYSRSTNKRFQVMRAMPKRDMASALEYRREILWIDIPRGRLAFIDTVYVFMEEAKDGVVGKEKYGSHTQYNKRLHLVAFMNDDVDIGQKERPRTYSMFQRMQDPVDTGVEYKPAPLSHDRYAIWDLELTPGLTEPWGPESQWYLTCPPFIAFDSEWNQIDYNPPIPPNSGPEFNGDMAGDGPFLIPIKAHGRINFYSHEDLYRHRLEDIEYEGAPSAFVETLTRQGVIVEREYIALDLNRTHTDFMSMFLDNALPFTNHAFHRWSLEADVGMALEDDATGHFPSDLRRMAQREYSAYRHGSLNAVDRDVARLAEALMADVSDAEYAIEFDDVEVITTWTFESEHDLPSETVNIIDRQVSVDSTLVGDYMIIYDISYHVLIGGNCAPAA